MGNSGITIGVYNSREKGTGLFTEEQFKKIEIRYIEYCKNLARLRELINLYFENRRSKTGSFHHRSIGKGVD